MAIFKFIVVECIFLCLYGQVFSFFEQGSVLITNYSMNANVHRSHYGLSVSLLPEGGYVTADPFENNGVVKFNHKGTELQQLIDPDKVFSVHKFFGGTIRYSRKMKRMIICDLSHNEYYTGSCYVYNYRPDDNHIIYNPDPKDPRNKMALLGYRIYVSELEDIFYATAPGFDYNYGLISELKISTGGKSLQDTIAIGDGSRQLPPRRICESFDILETTEEGGDINRYFIMGLIEAEEFKSMVQITKGVNTHYVEEKEIGESFGNAVVYFIKGIINKNEKDNEYGLAIGAPFHIEKGVINAGCVYLYDFSIKPTINTNYLQTLVGTVDESELFGFHVYNVGDMDQNGMEDLLISAPYGGRNNKGRLYIFYQDIDVFSSSRYELFEAEKRQDNGFFFGTSADAWDHNGDGFTDVIVGGIQNILYIRGREIAKVTYEFTSNVEKLQLDLPESCSKFNLENFYYCFELKYCLTYEHSTLESADFEIEIKEISQENFKISHFDDSSTNQSNHTVKFKAGEQECVSSIYKITEIDTTMNFEFMASIKSVNPIEHFNPRMFKGEKINTSIYEDCQITKCYPDVYVNIKSTNITDVVRIKETYKIAFNIGNKQKIITEMSGHFVTDKFILLETTQNLVIKKRVGSDNIYDFSYKGKLKNGNELVFEIIMKSPTLFDTESGMMSFKIEKLNDQEELSDNEWKIEYNKINIFEIDFRGLTDKSDLIINPSDSDIFEKNLNKLIKSESLGLELAPLTHVNQMKVQSLERNPKSISYLSKLDQIIGPDIKNIYKRQDLAEDGTPGTGSGNDDKVDGNSNSGGQPDLVIPTNIPGNDNDSDNNSDEIIVGPNFSIKYFIYGNEKIEDKSKLKLTVKIPWIFEKVQILFPKINLEAYKNILNNPNYLPGCEYLFSQSQNFLLVNKDTFKGYYPDFKYDSGIFLNSRLNYAYNGMLTCEYAKCLELRCEFRKTEIRDSQRFFETKIKLVLNTVGLVNSKSHTDFTGFQISALAESIDTSTIYSFDILDPNVFTDTNVRFILITQSLSELPIYIYIIPVVIGVALIVVIAVILHKRGFFKRKGKFNKDLAMQTIKTSDTNNDQEENSHGDHFEEMENHYANSN